MSDTPGSPSPSRRPLMVPAAPPRRPEAAAARRAAIPSARPPAAANGPRPVPGSIMRSLLSTRAWAVICGLGMLIAGVLLTLRAKTAWSELDSFESLPLEEFGRMERILNRGDVLVHFAMAVACLYATPRLFRYSSAIGRLRDGRRMAELENALRHQRAVWTVFGAAGVLWLVSFAGQIYYLVSSVQQLQEIEDARGELDSVE